MQAFDYLVEGKNNLCLACYSVGLANFNEIFVCFSSAILKFIFLTKKKTSLNYILNFFYELNENIGLAR